MKLSYKVLSIILLLEWFTINSLQQANIEITTWYNKIIGSALFLCPLLLIFRKLSKEGKIKPIVRHVCNFLFWLFLAGFILGALIEITLIVFIN